MPLPEKPITPFALHQEWASGENPSCLRLNWHQSALIKMALEFSVISITVKSLDYESQLFKKQWCPLLSNLKSLRGPDDCAVGKWNLHRISRIRLIDAALMALSVRSCSLRDL